jgi:hypothetical protein
MSSRPLDHPPRHTFSALIVFALVIFGLAAYGCAKHAEPESGKWITSLFVIPGGLQLIGLCFIRKRTTSAFWWFNWCSTFLCQGVYCLLWILYSMSDKAGQLWSYFALAWTFVVLGFVGILTFAIMRRSDRYYSAEEEVQTKKDKDTAGDPKPGQSVSLFRRFSWRTHSHNLSVGVEDHPIWAIMLFMALFLGVSYLFGFALAFHDKYARAITDGKKPALHMINLDSIDDDNKAPSQVVVNNGKENKTDNNQTTSTESKPDAAATSAIRDQEEFCFYFEEVKANVTQTKEDCSTDNPKRSDTYISRPQFFNSCSLKAIVNKLEQETKNGERVKVSLLGHTDNEPIKPVNAPSTRYQSNYELSEARAQNVQYQILQRLRDKGVDNLKNIEWEIFPAADEALPQVNRGAIRPEMFRPEELKTMNIMPNPNRQSFVTQTEAYFATEAIDSKLPAQEKRVVIATIEKIPLSPVTLQPDQIKNLTATQIDALSELRVLENAQSEHLKQSQAKPLRLMDYMYFSIYTITTTGYGDIIPVTAYAKFVTSVANIFEVIFLVVFFNALLSLKGNPDNPTIAKQASTLRRIEGYGNIRG